MNFMGIGFLELAVVFLVAFLVMGPGKSIEMAKTTGRVLRDVRRVFNEMAASIDLTGERDPAAPRAQTPPPSSAGAPPPPATIEQTREQTREQAREQARPPGDSDERA